MRLVTWNVLADDYISYGDYTACDPELLVPGARLDGIVRAVQGLDADVVCLQEVTPPGAAALGSRLCPKGSGRPDGCATIVRPGPWEVVTQRRLAYADGTPSSGHVALITTLHGDFDVVVANTHLRWAPPGDVEHVGVRQARELVGALAHVRSPAVVCGDLNAPPGSAVLEVFAHAGFGGAMTDPTAVVDGTPAVLDHVLARGLEVSATVSPTRGRSLPDQACLSDHLPVRAVLSAS